MEVDAATLELEAACELWLNGISDGVEMRFGGSWYEAEREGGWVGAREPLGVSRRCWLGMGEAVREGMMNGASSICALRQLRTSPLSSAAAERERCCYTKRVDVNCVHLPVLVQTMLSVVTARPTISPRDCFQCCGAGDDSDRKAQRTQRTGRAASR